MDVSKLLKKIKTEIEEANEALPEGLRFLFYEVPIGSIELPTIRLAEDIRIGFGASGEFYCDAAIPEEYREMLLMYCQKMRAFNSILHCDAVLRDCYYREIDDVDYDSRSNQTIISITLDEITAAEKMKAFLSDILLDVDALFIFPKNKTQMSLTLIVNKDRSDFLNEMGKWFKQERLNFKGSIVTNPINFKRLAVLHGKVKKFFGNRKSEIIIKKPDIFDERGGISVKTPGFVYEGERLREFADLLDSADGYSVWPLLNGRLNIGMSINDCYEITKE